MRKLTLQERCLLIFKRREAGLTVSQLADQLLMSKSNLSRIENGKIMVSDENMKIIESRFSIDFSMDNKLYTDMLSHLDNIVELLMFYKMFDEYSKERLECCNTKLLKSSAYPLYILSRLVVYSTKNIEEHFVERYISIFDSISKMLNKKCRKLLLLSKINYLYFDKKYSEALFLCNNQYIENDENILYDSYIFHIKAMLYICIGNQRAAYETINHAIELSEILGNSSRLIALNILKTNSLRLLRKYKEALAGDYMNLQYAQTHEIHIYDYAIFCNIGWTYYLLNDYENAIKYYKKAEEIDIDDDICFYMALSYFKIGERKESKKYLLEGRRAKNVGVAFPYLLDWLELTLNKRYSIKAEKKLLYCLKRYEDSMRIESRNSIYRLLIEHYTYHKKDDCVTNYSDKLANDINLKDS